MRNLGHSAIAPRTAGRSANWFKSVSMDSPNSCFERSRFPSIQRTRIRLKRKNEIVPKACQEYRNVSDNIELYRNAGDLKNTLYAVDLLFFLRFAFFLGFLHTVEVRGSSLLSPTIDFNNLRNSRLKYKVGCNCIHALIPAGKQVRGRRMPDVDSQGHIITATYLGMTWIIRSVAR